MNSYQEKKRSLGGVTSLLSKKNLEKYCSNVYKPGFLKTGLAKVRTHSTTWQLKTIKFVQRPIKSLYLTPGNK